MQRTQTIMRQRDLRRRVARYVYKGEYDLAATLGHAEEECLELACAEIFDYEGAELKGYVSSLVLDPKED
jgi:hypothetical protein